jgi:antitoxin component of MazEF toxin-antitoxin module
MCYTIERRDKEPEVQGEQKKKVADNTMTTIDVQRNVAHIELLKSQLGSGKFGKWGNSTAARIPAEVLKAANITDETNFNFHVTTEGDIVLRPIREQAGEDLILGKPRAYYAQRLAELRAQVTDDMEAWTEREIWGSGKLVGAERFDDGEEY